MEMYPYRLNYKSDIFGGFAWGSEIRKLGWNTDNLQIPVHAPVFKRKKLQN